MANRRLIEGDIVCVREDSAAALSREERTAAVPHVPCVVESCALNPRLRRVLWIKAPWQEALVAVWPSQVRLSGGTTELARVKTEAKVIKAWTEKQEREAARRRRIPKRKKQETQP